MWWWRRICAAAAVAAGVRCAHQVPPGGGPPDTTPPRVVASVPGDRALDVPHDIAVELTFSEWISPQKAVRGVTFFPTPAGGCDIRVRGRTLTIRPREPLADSTTYHVEVSSALTDLHGNPVGTPFHLVFSTGHTLDSGRVGGCVVHPTRRVIRPTVALIRADTGGADTGILGMPAYLTQTDSAGRFMLDHVRPGVYELVGFEDANSDGRLQPGKEQAYAGVLRRVEIGPAPITHVLYPVSSDTTARRIVSCTAVSDRLIMGTWNRRPPRALALDLPALRIAATDTVHHEPPIARYISLAEGTRFAIILAEPLRLFPYRLHYVVSPAPASSDSVFIRDSVRFNGVTTSDTSRPRMVSPMTLMGADLTAPVVLVWSEAVRLRAQRLVLTDTRGDTVTAISDTTFAETLSVTPARRLRPGLTYALRLQPQDIEDLSGLHPADTSAIELRVSTLPPDSFCFTFSGGAECLAPDPQRVWRFTPLRGGRPQYTRDNAGRFRFDTIPGGKGLIAFFGDRDGDGRHTAGELTPWWPPETIVPLYDTLEARVRWDIEGITVRGCDPCELGQISTAGSSAHRGK